MADRPRAWNSTLPRRAVPLKRTPFPAPSEAVRLPQGTGLGRNTPMLRAGSRRPRESAEKGKIAATRKAPGSGGSETFPRDVADKLDALYPWCARCGSTQNLQRHHRRIKGTGGDGRDHTHCACNGVRLCLRCHIPWAHETGRREAEAQGIIIPRSELEPWRRSVRVHTGPGSWYLAWPTCDGRLVQEKPEGALAA